MEDSSPSSKLALDLEPNDEEEDRHQPVVHPEMTAPCENAAAEGQRDICLPHGVIGVFPGRVSPDKRDGGDGEQKNAARGLHSCEAREGAGEGIDSSSRGLDGGDVFRQRTLLTTALGG